MVKYIGKTVAIIYSVILCAMMLPTKTEAFQPKLLWEKKLPFRITDIKIASETGDVVLCSKESRQIMVYDKNGNTKFHWGPRIDRLPFSVDIAENGNSITYSTAWTDTYIWEKKINVEKYGWDWRIHYVDKKGKEKWNKRMEGGDPYLSPDGNLIAIGASPGYRGGITMLDSTGKVLWKWAEDKSILNMKFTADGNYLVVSTGAVNLFSKNGDHLWEKGVGSIFSASLGANFISILDEGEENVIYDKQGNIILRKKCIISVDGSRAAVIEASKTTLIKLPTLEILKELSIIVSSATYPFINADFSFTGKYLAIAGSKSSSNNNLFVIDTLINNIWEHRVSGQVTHIFITKDGKHMLTIINSNQLHYYQTY